MSIDYDLLEEFKKELADRYEGIEFMELIIDHFELTVWDIIEMVGEDKLMELKFR